MSLNDRNEKKPRSPGGATSAWHAARRLLWPVLTFLVLLIPGWPFLVEYGAEASAVSQRVLYWGFGSAIGLSLAWLVVRVIEVLVWGFVERRFQILVPRLLKDIVVGLVFLMAVITIVGLVFRRDVTGLWVSSGVLGIIIGFAVRGTIADVFSGIALNVDRPFRVGDWIEVHCRGLAPVRGCVTEVNWRSTRIRTADNTLVVLPNSTISATLVINLSLPEPRSRFEQVFCLEFGVPPERVLRVLTAGARAAMGPLTDPPAKVYVHRVTEVGVEYKVRYWVDPIQISPRSARHAVTASILQHLYHAGISLAYPKQDLYLARMPVRQLHRVRDRRELLMRIDLFTKLQSEELELLAEAARERRYREGEAVVRQNEPGASVFVVVEGLLDVCKESDTNGDSVRVVALQPGQFFGEMSLLTGAPRAATVMAVTESIVYEIEAVEIQKLLLRRPELALHLADVAARRQPQLVAAGEVSVLPAEEIERTLTQQILEGMKGFFAGLRERLTFR